MNIAEFIDTSSRTQHMGELVSLFRAEIESFGYHTFCNFTTRGLQPDHDCDSDELHYNLDFFDLYEEKKYVEVDPVYKLLAYARMPFSWAQVQSLPLTNAQQEVMSNRTNAGTRSGISIPARIIPLHGRSEQSRGQVIGMSLCSNYHNVVQDKNGIATLYALVNQYQLVRSQLLDDVPLALPDIVLSPREKELLQWCAQGKSNNVIGTILSISEKTVEFHLKSAFKKLNVSSRTTAVLKAANMRLINL